MGRTHEEQLVLIKDLDAASDKVTVGATYYHYKNNNKVYQVVGLGFLEASDELCVIYTAQYGKGLTFIRLLSVWLETLDWNGKIVQRFTKL